MAILDRARNIARATAGRAAQSLAAFAYSPPEVRGVGSTASPFNLPQDARAQAVLDSRDALYGRTTYHAGSMQSYLSTNPLANLTPARIKGIFNEVLLSGYMLNKACLDEDIANQDGHLEAVQKARIVAVTGKPLTIEPVNGSDDARHVADYQQSVVDDMDHFDGSMYELGFANAAGYALQETIWEDKMVRFPMGKSILSVTAPHPRQLEWVSNKCTRFDVGKDRICLDLGGRYADLPDHKFVVHFCPGHFQKRRRGFMYQASPLEMIKWNAIARWAVVLDIWGIPVPIGEVDIGTWQDERRRAEYYNFLRDHGLGKPMLHSTDFKMQASASVSAGDARGMHAALIGWVNTEISKLVQGETLTTEMGGVGAYNASETHAAVKESIVAMDARALSGTLRSSLLRSILLRSCYLYDETGHRIGVNPTGISARLGLDPEEVLRLNGRPYWRIEREVTPRDRMDLYDKAINKLGMKIDEDQPYKEFGFAKARDESKRLGGEKEVLGTDERIVPTIGGENAPVISSEPDNEPAGTKPASFDKREAFRDRPVFRLRWRDKTYHTEESAALSWDEARDEGAKIRRRMREDESGDWCELIDTSSNSTRPLAVWHFEDGTWTRTL